jgi:hypothetical protein
MSGVHNLIFGSQMDARRLRLHPSKQALVHRRSISCKPAGLSKQNHARRDSDHLIYMEALIPDPLHQCSVVTFAADPLAFWRDEHLKEVDDTGFGPRRAVACSARDQQNV